MTLLDRLASAPPRPPWGLLRERGDLFYREDLLALPLAVPAELLADLADVLESLQEERTTQGLFRDEDLDALQDRLDQVLAVEPLQARALQFLLCAIPKAQTLGLDVPGNLPALAIHLAASGGGAATIPLAS